MKLDIAPERHEALKTQLETYGFAHLTRTASETDNYRVGYILDTPWGRRVRVSKLIRCETPEDHPILAELNEQENRRYPKTNHTIT